MSLVVSPEFARAMALELVRRYDFDPNFVFATVLLFVVFSVLVTRTGECFHTSEHCRGLRQSFSAQVLFCWWGVACSSRKGGNSSLTRKKQ